MSRLDSAIRRLRAQRACLEAAVRRARTVPGVVLELGLGNGRSYDHLRRLVPDREIFVFDRQLACHPDCRPDPDHLFLGEMPATLETAKARLGSRAALIHMDLGSGDVTETKRNISAIETKLPALLAPAGVVVSDQPLPGFKARKWGEALLLPPGLAPGRYYLYRAAGGAKL